VIRNKRTELFFTRTPDEEGRDRLVQVRQEGDGSARFRRLQIAAPVLATSVHEPSVQGVPLVTFAPGTRPVVMEVHTQGDVQPDIRRDKSHAQDPIRELPGSGLIAVGTDKQLKSYFIPLTIERPDGRTTVYAQYEPLRVGRWDEGRLLVTDKPYRQTQTDAADKFLGLTELDDRQRGPAVCYDGSCGLWVTPEVRQANFNRDFSQTQALLAGWLPMNVDIHGDPALSGALQAASLKALEQARALSNGTISRSLFIDTLTAFATAAERTFVRRTRKRNFLRTDLRLAFAVFAVLISAAVFMFNIITSRR
jgi:hypothetical protein